MLTKTTSLELGSSWTAMMIGTAGEYGLPEEMPFDMVRKSRVKVGSDMLLVEGEKPFCHTLDIGNTGVLNLGPGNGFGTWVPMPATTFSDLVVSALIPFLRKVNTDIGIYTNLSISG